MLCEWIGGSFCTGSIELCNEVIPIDKSLEMTW